MVRSFVGTSRCFILIDSRLAPPLQYLRKALLRPRIPMVFLKNIRVWIWKNGIAEHVASMEDEHLMTKESDSLEASNQQLHVYIRKLKRRTWILGALVGVLIVAFPLALRHVISSIPAQTRTSKLVSQLPVKQVIFERNSTFAAPSSPESDRAWASLAPPGDGFILLSNSTREQNFLPLGKVTDEGQVYDISLFHQLHCLSAIRTHLFTLQAAMSRNNRDEIFEILLKPKEEHIFHCFDYIRQALMCAGDLTIEWPREEPDGRRFAVDGWGIPHECKSWVRVHSQFSTNTALLTTVLGRYHGLDVRAHGGEVLVIQITTEPTVEQDTTRPTDIAMHTRLVFVPSLIIQPGHWETKMFAHNHINFSIFLMNVLRLTQGSLSDEVLRSRIRSETTRKDICIQSRWKHR